MSKIALVAVAPEWIAAARLTIGAVALLVFAIPRDAAPSFKLRDLSVYAWLGFFGNAAPFFAITWGMQFITSGVAGLLMGTIPLITILMSHFALRNERLTVRRTLGFTLGFAGIIVLIGADALWGLSLSGSQLLGELAVVSGCVMYGINSISAKRFGTGKALQQSAGVLTAGALMSVCFAMATAPFTLIDAPLSALLAIAGLGLLPTSIATLLWFKLIERTSPTFTSMSNYLVPVYALLFGALTLGETIGWNAIAALALILSGIAVTQVKRQPSR